MGADIHTFIEYGDFNDQNGEPYWQCFGGQINQGRDYTMFGLLANVRCDGAIFEPRGLPDGRHSYQVDDYMRIRIDDKYGREDMGGYTTLERAKSWNEPIEERDGKPYRVMNPDLHSHSWLTVDELKLVLAYYTLGDKAERIDPDLADNDRMAVMQAVAALQGKGERYSASWDATVAAMEAFEARGCQTRLVFCFDN